jgi:23S rRNA (cytosine1962-C5)-methyltransferase
MKPTLSNNPRPIKEFDYQLLDTGNFKKLERFGPYTFVRPAPQAIWPPQLSETQWDKANGEFSHHKGKSTGGGEWTFRNPVPKNGWPLRFQDLTFTVQTTSFGHLGLFPEQAKNWDWIANQVRELNGNKPNVLNMFGYTGASTLAAAARGANVTHLDASKTSVTWARKNLETSGLTGCSVRWIVDDAEKFLQREYRRDRKYDALIMDPPSFGRGPKGEVWNIETQMTTLLSSCKNVLSESPKFILLTTHSPGISSLTLKNMLIKFLVSPDSGIFQTGDMSIYDTGSGLQLPNGFYARFSSNS